MKLFPEETLMEPLCIQRNLMWLCFTYQIIRVDFFLRTSYEVRSFFSTCKFDQNVVYL